MIAKAFLRNAGAVPILPSDYHEKLSIGVQNPWKIVSVENSHDIASSIELRWKRVSDTRFEAEPALLNPGDTVSTNVYLTNARFTGIQMTEKHPEAQIEWRARITNLRAFTEKPAIWPRPVNTIDVHLTGWALVFTIIVAALFQAFYVHMLSRAGLLRLWAWRSIALVVGASLLSFAAAESSATYFFGHPLGKLIGVGVDHWLNAPWIILHALALTLLYWRTTRGWRPDREEPSAQPSP